MQVNKFVLKKNFIKYTWTKMTLQFELINNITFFPYHNVKIFKFVQD